MYPICPASVEPEKNASNAVSDPIEIAPNAADDTNTTSDALFGVCVRGSTRESHSENGRARSRAYAKKMREAATNCGTGYQLRRYESIMVAPRGRLTNAIPQAIWQYALIAMNAIPVLTPRTWANSVPSG